jgi:PST family polysaccharide transporter
MLFLGIDEIGSWLFSNRLDPISTLFLAVALTISAASGCNLALLQGTRHIKEFAIAQVLSAAFGSLICLVLYASLGTQGIAPGLVASSLALLFFTGRFARRIELPRIKLGFRATIFQSRELISLSIALIWSGLLVYALDAVARGLLVRSFGLFSGGLYQAAWSISGLFAGFVIAAMGSDFYPRLTALIHDKTAATTLINQQTEIGVLLAVPGLALTICFATEILAIVYSREFVSASELLRYFALGIFGRVISWPLGFIQLAKGKALLFLATETFFGSLYLGGMLYFLEHHGLHGIGQAFALNYLAYTVTMLMVARRLIGFRWSSSTRTLLTQSLIIILAGFFSTFLDSEYALAFGILITVVATVFCVRGLASRLGKDHPLTRTIINNPTLRKILNIS